MKKILLAFLFTLIPVAAQAMQPDVQIDDDVFVRYDENSDQRITLTLYSKSSSITIGYAIMRRISKHEFVASDLYIFRKDLQNKGYGTILASLTLKECLKKTPKKISGLAVPLSRDLLPKLIKFYQKFGKVKIIKNYGRYAIIELRPNEHLSDTYILSAFIGSAL